MRVIQEKAWWMSPGISAGPLGAQQIPPRGAWIAEKEPESGTQE